MNVNLEAWDNFIGRSLIVFLLIEGVKTFPWIARVSAGSWSFKLLENVAANLILTLLVRKTGSDIFIGEGPWPLVLSVVFGSLATAGLHRLKEAFERRSPSDPAWEAAAHARGSVHQSLDLRSVPLVNRLLESLDARRSAARPVQVAHSLSLAIAAGALAALAGSKGVSFLGWLEGSATGLVLPLILSLFLVGGGLFLAAGAAAGGNLAHRRERERLQL